METGGNINILALQEPQAKNYNKAPKWIEIMRTELRWYKLEIRIIKLHNLWTKASLHTASKGISAKKNSINHLLYRRKWGEFHHNCSIHSMWTGQNRALCGDDFKQEGGEPKSNEKSTKGNRAAPHTV